MHGYMWPIIWKASHLWQPSAKLAQVALPCPAQAPHCKRLIVFPGRQEDARVLQAPRESLVWSQSSGLVLADIDGLWKPCMTEIYTSRVW